MSILLDDGTGLRELTPELARAWFSRTGRPLPSHLDDGCIELFAAARDKAYSSNKQEEFLSDLQAFYSARKGLKMALKNLDGYEEHLVSQQVTDDLVREVLGVERGGKVPRPLKQFVGDVIDSMLTEERLYVAECRDSLNEQLDWHVMGRVDKAPVPSRKMEGIFSLIAQEPEHSKAKDKAKNVYYEPIRARLMSQGFVVPPRGVAMGGVFPEQEWLRDLSESVFLQRAKDVTDDLVQRYHLLGDGPDSLTRLLVPQQERWKHVRDALSSAVGCLCVSWTRHRVMGKPVYVPILGLSGVVEQDPAPAFYQKYCRHLGLPSWKPDPSIPEVAPYQESGQLKAQRTATGIAQQRAKAFLQPKNKPQPGSDEEGWVTDYRTKKAAMDKLVTDEAQAYRDTKKARQIEYELAVNYDTMLERTNLAALGYHARSRLGLRTPSRQALFSYVSFRENKKSQDLKLEVLQPGGQGVDLWVAGWHTLSCAEPAALMTASSYFNEGCDVLICFPYEGFNPTGSSRNRPKETCPWCAAVELGFRSLSENGGGVETSVDQGVWLTQHTLTMQGESGGYLSVKEGFDAFDDDNPIMGQTRTTLGGDGERRLVKNKDLKVPAYSPAVETKIGRLRSMYHLLGLLNSEVVALDRPLYGRVGEGAVWHFLR
ncbi:hypothetical protein SAMN05443572_111252 [Myxococcus fulvus]|uniref:Uncharacterized protein n=1 Tax=Myxococcus fulvus TaxID=33 RepID=A0A511TFB4_MYXFU|nr:hypothetical protein [Myxococcus fulvus]GEN12082.1 hypothetical protein MFU01_71190 [Myxococcus fulvus]SEU36640.1 hypothetical protein SAMN05443572_111252 [Myxococcus fulvus]